MVDYALDRKVRADVGPVAGRRAEAAPAHSAPGLDWLDCALICLFLLGLYTNYTVQISAKVPFPSAPAGIAGLILLGEDGTRSSPRDSPGFIGVVALYLFSVLCAPNIAFLPRRTNGLIQLTYSITIGYALFLTVTQGTRRQIAGLFLGFALVILVGCLLEGHAGFRPVSDAVRNIIYKQGIYENDLRDTLFYGRVRPKFFASEPASVTFCFALFTFIWMVISTWRWKLVAYVGLVGVGLFAMPGPTLLLMLVLILPYMLFLTSRARQAGWISAACCWSPALRRFSWSRSSCWPSPCFPRASNEVMSGNDPSFFYRVQGPALAGLDAIGRYPFAGNELTGEPFFEREVTNLYLRSPFYSARWQVVTPATELVINYFWLHWIYLGLIWGLIMAGAITIWFRVLGVPSPAFCWMVWAILGQASGAYVGPTCWAVLFLAAAAAVLYQRPEPARARPRVPVAMTLPGRSSRPRDRRFSPVG